MADKLHPCHLGIVVGGLGVEKCSGSLHGNTAETHAQAATRQDTERQLNKIYASRNLLEPWVRELLAPDIEIRLHRPINNVTQNWLVMTGPIVKDSMQRVKCVALGVCSIRSYFPQG